MVKIAFDPIYAYPLPDDHRFPMLKYDLIPAQLMHEGTCEAAQFFAPSRSSKEVVLLTHTEVYYEKLLAQKLTPSEQRKIGFQQSPALIQRELTIMQGTIDVALSALENGIGLNIAGGTHHAFTDRGEGFCILNDMAIASNYLLSKNLAQKILIIDLDVHQGNGTAKIMEGNEQVFTFSVHGATNYPFHKEQSNLDIGLPDGTDGPTYLKTLEKTLPKLIEQVRPDFAFYLAGVDILNTDKFGKFNVTIEECKQRDAIVLNHLRQNKIPVAVALGGGYSPDIKVIVEAHCNTFRLAMDLYGG